MYFFAPFFPPCSIILALNFNRTLIVALVSGLENGQNLTFWLLSRVTAGLQAHAEGQNTAQCLLCFHRNFKQQFYLVREEPRQTVVSFVLLEFSCAPGPALLDLPAAESIPGEACKGSTSAQQLLSQILQMYPGLFSRVEAFLSFITRALVLYLFTNYTSLQLAGLGMQGREGQC